MNRLVLLLAILTVGCSNTTPKGCADFDRAGWLKVDTNRDSRGLLADRLLESCNMKGMSREQIVELLGPPTETPYFREYDFVYVIGLERGFIAIDYEWLVFKFDQSGRVTKYRLVTD